MALVLRIKFPPTYPLIYKTLRLDENLTCRGAVETIAETLHLPEAAETVGLYIPAEALWLDAEKLLADYPSLADADEIEYKDRAASGNSGGGGGDGCCVIL
mmetsp:Transcript_36686/g.51156  ORF Transcript_36686/g.51156 Transcript_36686/m.51156 type:complete len:101 (+) Transcript_36686:85-387(+)